MKIIIVSVICIFLSICGSSGAEEQTQKYGEKVSYASGNELKFPDFSIKFVGKREVGYPTADSPRKMTFYDFEAVKGDAKQKVSWSSGTGDIGPTFFEFGGANYALELSQSDILKSLGDGNFVIWKKADYEEAVKKKRN